jgi:hypothetical protein
MNELAKRIIYINLYKYFFIYKNNIIVYKL